MGSDGCTWSRASHGQPSLSPLGLLKAVNRLVRSKTLTDLVYQLSAAAFENYCTQYCLQWRAGQAQLTASPSV